MNGLREEIPKSVWYVGQFLFQFQETLEHAPQTTVEACFDDFIQNQQLQNVDGFHLKNQGTMLMLLYGLLVVPREMWEHQGLPVFAFNTRVRFHFCVGGPNMSSAEFLRFMRHAIAHANFDMAQNGTYTFRNRPPKTKEIDFEVEVARADLGEFVAEVGQYYINSVAPQIQ